MSIQAIQKYHNEIEEIKDFSGETKEQSIKVSFLNLLNYYCRKRNLLTVSEVSIKNTKNEVIRPDGIIKNRSRFNCGYWESKANVNLEKEIELKINSGYPLINTLFQDAEFAILYQDEKLVFKVLTEDYPEFDKLLTQFVSYESKEIKEFNIEVEKFKKNLPDILKELNAMIKEQEINNKDFIISQKNFFQVCQKSINKNITLNDINEMLIQHILTEEIFISIFNDAQFHHENNIAKELYKVESTFFKGAIKRNTLDRLQKYYLIIKSLAAVIDDHHDKQVFLKTIYEDFYKAYNPDKADTMGIVYTPSEIIKFQLESVDYLLEKHFKKTLANKEVKILDPCTGTGTYICDLIDYLPKKDLEHKFKNEIFANELGLLPYYIANLNIEYTYRQRMGSYVEFEHICWTDTLDNTGYLKEVNMDLFDSGNIFIKNTERIKKQNEQKISVIIGNPPYNANQKNENDNNKNREYYDSNLEQLDNLQNNKAKKKGGIDGRIADTYIKESNAQKTKLYDPYARFYRWASDRISEEQGIISFVTNNSFIESKTFDGFRKCVAREFDFIYVINLGGDMRKNTDSNDNVFGITVGVALLFLVKTNNNPIKRSKLFYYRFANGKSREDKLRLLEDSKFEKLESEFDRIIPDDKNNWINQTYNDFNSLIPVCNKEVKLGKSQNAIFSLYSNGVSTNRDEWVYDFSKENLAKKMQFFFKEYNNEVTRWKKWKKENSYIDIKDESNPVVDEFLHEKNVVKWSSRLKRDKLRKHKKGKFDKDDIKNCLYRPFVKNNIYNGYIPIDIKGEFNKILFSENKFIVFNNGALLPFNSIAVNSIVDLHFNGDSVCLPLSAKDVNNIQSDNITDWALNEFKSHYQAELTKLNIFHYVYAVLHNPAYREKYELNLKRDFPHIPFYENFSQWVDVGKQLMDLHLNYETAEPYALKRQDLKVSKIPKVKLKADKEQGLILIDDNTTLSEVPAAAWDYKLGNRCALEWILDQYKEKKPKDATIAEQFNTYRFADYKEQVIELLSRVCTVSVETVRIVELLRTENSPQTEN